MNNFRVLQDCRLDELEKRYRAIAETDQVPIAKLGLYATASMQHLAKHLEAFQQLKDNGFLCTDLPADDGRWYPRVAAFFAATLDEAVAGRTIRVVDTGKVGTMFLDAILSLMAHRTGSAGQEEIEDDVRVLMDLYLIGLSASP